MPYSVQVSFTQMKKLKVPHGVVSHVDIHLKQAVQRNATLHRSEKDNQFCWNSDSTQADVELIWINFICFRDLRSSSAH